MSRRLLTPWSGSRAGLRGGGHATPTASADPRSAALQYAACMRAHGANVPDPTFDQNGKPQWPSGTDVKGAGNPAAAQACLPILLR